MTKKGQNGHPTDSALAEAWNNTAPADRLVVENIAKRVDNRIVRIAGIAPKVPFYVAYKGFFIAGAVLLAGVASWVFWPQEQTQEKIVVAAPVLKKQAPIAVAEIPTTPVAQKIEEPVAQESVVKTAEKVQENNPTDALEVNGELLPHETFMDELERTKENEVANPTPESETNQTITSTLEPQSETPKVATKVFVEYLGIKPAATTKKKTKSLETADMPSYKGGAGALEHFVSSEVKTAVLQNPGLVGKTAHVKFQVNGNGKVSNPRIRYGAEMMNAEVLRIINQMPSWNSAAKSGKYEASITVTFK